MTSISMKKGLWIHLDYEAHRIAVHLSLRSGKEVVYVDDHPVSEQRNFGFRSQHDIVLNKAPFSLEVDLENPFNGRTEIRLKKGARTVARSSNAFLKADKKSAVYIATWLLIFIVLGGFAGYLLGSLVKHV